jgi:hypothetical protein
VKSGEFSSYYASGIGYREWLRREQRRKRLKTLAGYVAAVALALLLAWVAVGVAVGR